MSKTSTPIVVGVGQFANPIDAPEYTPMSPVEIAAAAARAAIRDAEGATAWHAMSRRLSRRARLRDTGPPRDASFGKSKQLSAIDRQARRNSARTRNLGTRRRKHAPEHWCRKCLIASGAVNCPWCCSPEGEAVSTVRALVQGGEEVDWSETLDEPVEDRGSGVGGPDGGGARCARCSLPRRIDLWAHRKRPAGKSEAFAHRVRSGDGRTLRAVLGSGGRESLFKYPPGVFS